MCVPSAAGRPILPFGTNSAAETAVDIAIAQLSLYDDLVRAAQYLIQFQRTDNPSIALQDVMNTLESVRRLEARIKSRMEAHQLMQVANEASQC